MEYIDYALNHLKNPETREILKLIGGFIAALLGAAWLIYTYFSRHSKKPNEYKEVDISNGKIIVAGNNITNIININPPKSDDKILLNGEELLQLLSSNRLNLADKFDNKLSKLGDVAYQKGVFAELIRNYIEADCWLSKAVQLQPNNIRFLNSAGNIKRILGFYKEAEELFKRAMEILGDYE